MDAGGGARPIGEDIGAAIDRNGQLVQLLIARVKELEENERLAREAIIKATKEILRLKDITS